MKTSYLAVILALFGVSSTLAQSSRETVSQSVEWMATTSNIKLNKYMGVVLDGQFRFARDFEPMQFQIRTGMDFYINKHLAVMPLGYVYVWNPQYGKQPSAFVNNEHRLFQQVVYKHSAGRFSFHHRARLEQRFLQVHAIDNGETIDKGYEMFVNRFRYRFMVNIPLNHATMEPSTVYLSVFDEIFASWGDPVTYHEPDQNRIFVGGGYQVNKMLSVQVGPFYQMLIKANGAKQENNYGAFLQLTYNVDASRSQ